MTPPEWSGVGPWLVMAGVVLVVTGLLVWAGALGWVGRLPGDLRFQGERTRFYLPITSMVILSVILTVVVNLLRRFLG